MLFCRSNNLATLLPLILKSHGVHNFEHQLVDNSAVKAVQLKLKMWRACRQHLICKNWWQDLSFLRSKRLLAVAKLFLITNDYNYCMPGWLSGESRYCKFEDNGMAFTCFLSSCLHCHCSSSFHSFREVSLKWHGEISFSDSNLLQVI